ncbi:MAG: DMT family transporter [Burkholderiaceae bacterium]
MAWLILFLAGLLEIVWLLLLKMSDGYTRTGYTVSGLALSFVSFGMVGWAVKTLPIGTAYAVWTGIGVAGGAIAGIVLFGEPATAMRVGCIVLIVAGIVGLKLSA